MINTERNASETAWEKSYFCKRTNELLRIYDHFGYKNQLEKLSEEIKEFSEAYTDWVANGFDIAFWDHMIEELADVDILISQFRKNIIRNDDNYLFHQDLYHAEEAKIARTLSRIKEGYYDEEEK
jgi:hypothetical protein